MNHSRLDAPCVRATYNAPTLRPGWLTTMSSPRRGGMNGAVPAGTPRKEEEPFA
jgi:hypothetical protein